MKRIISLLLAFSFVLAISPAVYAAEFSDINSEHWAYTYVTTLVSSGTINGYADGTFEINCNNPLFEALLREGVTYFPVIMWTTRKEDYEDFVSKYAPYTEFVLK